MVEEPKDGGQKAVEKLKDGGGGGAGEGGGKGG